MNTTTLNMTTLDGGVIIKRGTAPAPPSGGESGGSNWRYFDVSEIDDATKETLWAVSQTCRCFMMNLDVVQPPLLASKYGVLLANIYCLGFDFSLMMKDAQGTASVEQLLSKYGVLDTLLAKEITQDEFLNKTFE